MASTSATGKFSAKIAAVVALIPLAILTWFIAPFFLPVWRWQHVSFEAVSKASGVPMAELTRQYTAVIRHASRGEGDPAAWQLVTLDPAWDKADEEKLLVRVTAISDRTGAPPSGLLLGSGHRRDRYFRVRCWRLPPGSLGFNAKRPVILYDGGSLDKLDIGQAEGMDGNVRDGGWDNDDKEVDDGWAPRGSE